MGIFSRLSHWERYSFSFSLLQGCIGWASFPIVPVYPSYQGLLAYLISVTSRKGIYLVYYCLFKCLITAAHSEVPKFEQIISAGWYTSCPLFIYTRPCTCTHNTQALHSPTWPPPHTQKWGLHHVSQWEETVSIPVTSGDSCWLLDDSISSKARMMCPEKECEPGMCLNADTASGEPTAASCKSSQGLVWAGVGGDRVRIGRGWFSASVFTYHHQSIHQPKDPH